MQNLPESLTAMTVCLLVLALAAASVSASAETLAEEGAPRHPTVYQTPENVARARDNIKRFDWAKKTADEIVAQADGWLERPDGWYRDNMPGAGACFAYGFTGCPICGANLGGWWIRANASWDKPGQITCGKGHLLPDTAHPDPGTGYRAKDGRIHYLKGTYNSWAIEQMTMRASDSLAAAYSLTGDEKYARKAALILDLVAAIYPACDKGSWDYPSDPPSGRLNRPWYQVARVLVHLVNQYDQIYASKALDEPSAVPGLTRRANIEENMLKNGAAYCYQQSLAGGLHNGEADYIRGTLAAGVCLGIPEYVRWAVDGPFGILTMLDNNLDRDGAYFETSPGYSTHARGLYTTFAEPLINYRGSAYPNGLNLYEHPQFRRFMTLYNTSFLCAGHTPPFGDNSPNTKRVDPSAPVTNRSDYLCLEYLLAREDDPRERRDLEGILRWAARGEINAERANLLDRRWALFHTEAAPGGPARLTAEVERAVTGCHLLGQKGIGILRAGEGKEAQALLLRFGPSLVHGHLDDLNINYFARGYELTYDLGYDLGSTHTQVGWARQTASHNLVVVDESSQYNARSGSGGSLHLLTDTPDVKAIEASSEISYAALGVSLYRRTNALIAGPGGSYLLDIFRVRGGKQHDYLFHAPSPEAAFDGVRLGEEQPGSLAGADIAWGEKQLNDGDMDGYPNKPYWAPPPGNGYGFLCRPRHGQPEANWSASYDIGQDATVRFLSAPQPGTEVITAVAPGIYPHHPKARYLLERRKGENLESEFAAVIEPSGGKPAVESIERVALSGPEGEIPAVALTIRRSDGAVDFVYSSGDEIERSWDGGTAAGRFVHARVKGGKAQSLAMTGASGLQAFGVSVKPEEASWHGRVTALDYDKNTVTLNAPLPAGEALKGQIIAFSNPRYTRSTSYRIAKVEKAGTGCVVHLESRLTLGRGIVSKISGERTIVSGIPHEYARPLTRGAEPGFFNGKLLASSGGASAHIRHAVYGTTELTLHLDSASGFKQGDEFRYCDVQEGDRCEVLSQVWLKRTGVGLKADGTAAVEISEES